ncbi:MAG TPA: ATP-dependent sacrificial sulfur transferase LarE, partial [Firmicutes bacterium]|nr:ATP-dependent sacrificial sulfur transferase LarE [Bacillota bacterium]
MWENVDTQTEHKQLKENLRNLGSVVVAYSGGVDSALLLAVAHKTLGSDHCLAVTGISPSLAGEEYDDARRVAEQIGARWITVETNEISDLDYRRNDENRCYYCKSELFDQLRKVADEYGLATIVDGYNADDVGDWRPGERAARERDVHSPLKDAGLGKEAIRALSREYGLPTADKPSFACLASRLPYGTEVTPERLELIARAETTLREVGFGVFRVRYHGPVARLELGPEEIERIQDRKLSSIVNDRLRAHGFEHVTVDLAGFRSGSQNESAQSDDSLVGIGSVTNVLK